MKLDLQLKKYKPYIDWINLAREKDISWEKIVYGNGENDQDLQNFLEIQTKTGFWAIDIHTWKEIVESHKKFIDNCQPAIISDPNDPMYVEMPEHGCLDTYLKKLEKNHFSDFSIKNIFNSTKDILSRLRLETEHSNPIRGLVMGNVQSGKTANMAALIALAADYGYNMFIVLSGTIENLRVQTEERLYHDLNSGKTTISFQRLQDLSAKHSINDLSNLLLANDDKKRYIYVCLKNSIRLKNLLNWINKDEKKKKQLKVLVIDDEADQAGINTANIDKNLQTSISQLIEKLVFAGSNNSGGVIIPYKCMNYIAYTATPYANFLNVANESSLYPKNFIATLNTPKEYFGPQQIFGSDESEYKGLSIINKIEIDDVERIKNLNIHNIPKSLIRAVYWFICTVAVFRYYEIKKPVSMLIHTSQKQDDHSSLANLLKHIFNSMSKKTNYIDDIKEVWDEQTNLFSLDTFRQQYNDYDRDDKDIYDYPAFEDIEDTIKYLVKSNINHILLNEDKSIEFCDGVHLCVDNCSNNSTSEDIFLRLAYPKSSDDIEAAPAFIVIGGSTLSRGLTLEGLTTTYFLRTTQQADTLMQMGRWFGYRRNYELLPRLWLSNKTIKQFEFLSQLDEDLRIELRNMQMFGRKPSEYGPKINRLPRISYLNVTNKMKMQKALVIDGDYSDYKGQTTAVYKDELIIKNNFDVTFEFINSLGNFDNNKFKNNFNKDSKVWLDIPYQSIFNYLSKLSYPSENSVFADINSICDWYKEKYENKELDNWNIVLPGLSNSDNSQNFNLFNLNLVNRTIIDDDDTNIMRFGSITDPDAKKMDVDDSLVKDFNTKDNYKTHRNKAGYITKPVLAIYIIDKNSKVKNFSKNSTGKKRIGLNCENHVVGYDLYIPYGNLDKRKKGGKITVQLQFDMSGDVDEE